MLSQAQRTTILELHTQGVSKREIARMLGVSRPTVRQVLRSKAAQVPELHRPEKAEPYRQRILELFSACKGNLVRVHEELTAGGVALSYPALTAFCRRHGIGQSPIVPAGRYDFEPGEEMQHDTSPHEVQLAGKKRKVQTASAVLCYSRMLFFQVHRQGRKYRLTAVDTLFIPFNPANKPGETGTIASCWTAPAVPPWLTCTAAVPTAVSNGI